MNATAHRSCHALRALFMALCIGLALAPAVRAAEAEAAASAPAPAPSTSGPLVFLGDRNLAPWESLVEGQPQGASVDLARAIGRQLGRPVEVRLYEWADAQRRLLTGEGHALTQIGRSPEREQIYELSRTVFSNALALFVQARGAESWNMDNLSGRRIGVTAGGQPRLLLAARAPTAELVAITNLREGTERLLRGELDAVAAPTWAELHLLHGMGISSITQLTPFHYSSAGVAVRKGDTALLAQIDSAIVQLEANGEIARILDAWAPQRVFLFSGSNLRAVQGVAAALVAALLALGVATTLLVRQRTRLKREIEVRRAAEQQSQADERRLHQLQNLTAALGRAVLPADVGTVLLQHCRTITGAGRCHLLEYDAVDRLWRTLALEGFADDTAQRLAHIEADAVSPFKPLLDYRSPWHAANPAELATLDGALALQAHYGAQYGEQQAMYASPLLLSAATRGNQPPIGALLLSWPEPHAMSEAETARLEVVAKLFAQTLERTRLRGAERRALARQQALHGLAETLTTANTARDVCWAGCTSALRALDALNVSMALFDTAQPAGQVPAGTRLTMIESSRVPPSVAERFRHFSVDSSLPIARAARTATAVDLPDRAALERESPELGGFDGIADVQASAAVPLLLGLGPGPGGDESTQPPTGLCQGAIALDFDQPRTLDREERQFLRALAAMAARGIERCRLLEQAAAALLISDAERRLLDGIIEQFPVGLLVADVKTGQVTRESASLPAVLGRSALGADARGLHEGWRAWRTDSSGGPSTPLLPQHWPLARALREGVATTGLRLQIEHPDGGRRTIDCWGAPVHDSQGRMIAAAAMLVDVSGQIALQDSRRESELRLQLAVESTGLGTWDVDVRDGSAHWSPSMYTLLGLPPGDGAETAERFMQQVLAEDRPQVEAEVARAVAERSGFDITFRIRRGDGDERWLVGRGHVLRHAGADDQAPRMIGVNYDVTAMMQTRQPMAG